MDSRLGRLADRVAGVTTKAGGSVIVGVDEFMA
jgi:hypothetical protein